MSGLRSSGVFSSVRRFSGFSPHAKDNPYDILGVQPTATQDEIKKAFYTMSLIHHPDRNNGSKASHNKFTKLTWAYKLLSNVDERRRHDKSEAMAREFSRGFTPHVRPNTRRVFVRSSRKIYDFEKYKAAHYPKPYDEPLTNPLFEDSIHPKARSRHSLFINLLLIWSITAMFSLVLFSKQKKI